jgi:histidinol-phosphate aminotransferase
MKKTNSDLLDNIKKVTPYVSGEQPKGTVIKLNTNENPYPPSPMVTEALEDLKVEDLKLYPDPDSKELTEVLADYHQVDKGQIFVGAGSDEVLSLCFLTFFNSGKAILFPDITYSFYKVWAGLYCIPYECPFLDEDFRLSPGDYKGTNGGIIFPNPNAPTGIYEELDVIEEVVRDNPNVVVIIDEAYIDFAGPSACDLLPKYENLVVVRTFSKSRSMAGMRIGYGIGSPILIEALHNVKNSFNSYPMNQPAQKAGIASVLDQDYFAEKVKEIINTRKWTEEKLSLLDFKVLKSSGNFVFAKHKNQDGFSLFQGLRDQGIFIRHWNQERIKDYLRITIGTPEEMEELLRALEDLLLENR